MNTKSEINECRNTVSDLKHIETLIKKIYGSEHLGDDKLCSIKKGDLLRLLSIPEDKFKQDTPYYTHNPYAKVFFSAKNQILPLDVDYYDVKVRFHGHLNGNLFFLKFIDAVKYFTSLNWFRTTVIRHGKAQAKREKSINDYIDALFENYARLTVVRVDLYLNQSPWKINFTTDLLNEVQAYWSKMRRDLYESKLLPRSVGFICSLELGHIVGFHFHLMVFFDGSLYQSDINLAMTIGEHWKGNITCGKGRYHNCNAKKSQYKKLGIGRIEYWNKEAVENLKSAARYLAKIDFTLDSVIGSAKAFYRGNMPSKRSGLGRPRLKSPLTPEPNKST